MLSKGHAAPILYAAWAEAGAFDRAELLKLREIGSDLEGHPTPRLPFVDVATGSLGQGICAAIGIALNARRIKSDYRTYVLLGDGESAEGSVWEAADVAAMDRLDNLCGITDVNALGQSRADDVAARHGAVRAPLARVRLARDRHRRPRHDAILDALAEARAHQRAADDDPGADDQGQGRVVRRRQGRLARQGVQEGRGARSRARRARDAVRAGADGVDLARADSEAGRRAARRRPTPKPLAPPAYKLGEQVATREAYGTALAKLGEADPRVVALDADVKNSTFSDKFEKAFPDRFYQNFIAEQVMVGAAMGLAARGAIPFPSTFACFLTRAADFIRMAAISNVDIKLAGSHAGVSIGEDGPSQMALEDLAMCRAQPNFTVLYPCDAVSAERLVALTAYHPGPAYIRTSRPKTPVIYGNDETFAIGGLKVLRESADDVATVVGAGVTRVRGAEGLRPAESGGHRRSASSISIRCRRSIATALIAAGARDRRASDHGRRSLRGRRHRRRGGRSGGRCRLHGPPPRRPRDPAQRQARRAARSLRHLRLAHRRAR